MEKRIEELYKETGNIYEALRKCGYKEEQVQIMARSPVIKNIIQQRIEDMRDIEVNQVYLVKKLIEIVDDDESNKAADKKVKIDAIDKLSKILGFDKTIIEVNSTIRNYTDAELKIIIEKAYEEINGNNISDISEGRISEEKERGEIKLLPAIQKQDDRGVNTKESTEQSSGDNISRGVKSKWEDSIRGDDGSDTHDGGVSKLVGGSQV